MILVCDDDAVVKKHVKRVIARLSPKEEVITVNSCGELIDLLVIKEDEGVYPDLIMIDLIMPRLTGIECIEMLKFRFPLIPSVAMSAISDENIIAEIYAAGFNGFLHKGFFNKDNFEIQIESAIHLWINNPKPNWITYKKSR